MRNYTQLTEVERYQIAVLFNRGDRQKEIAEALGRSPSTISRELRRNRGLRGYRPKQAHGFALQKRREARKRRKVTPEVAGWIGRLLAWDLSPEQAAGYLESEKGLSLSPETVYRHVYGDRALGGTLYRRLRRVSKKYRKRYGSYQRRGQIVGRVGIEDRPVVVDRRIRIGDWEGDTVIGKRRRSALLTVVERKTLYTRIVRLKSRDAAELADGLTGEMDRFKDRVKTLTFDNGKEFAGHRLIASRLNARVYFARPYRSWERGTNENTNGLIRQYFPKGTDFNRVTDEEIERVMDRLNHRPRKTRGFKTPAELFLGQKVDLLAA
jgi:IS30 family transposase